MPDITVKLSGFTDTRISNLVLKEDFFSNDYEKFVKDGQTWIQELRSHFKNCIFNTADLKRILEQDRCRDILFSHIKCDNQTEQENGSTAIAVGMKADGFIESPDVYASKDINLLLQYPNSFDPDKIICIKNNVPDNKTPPFVKSYDWLEPPSSDLEGWLAKSKTKTEEIIKEGNPDKDKFNPLIYGVYYDKDTLEESGILSEKRLALLPVNMMVTWNLGHKLHWTFPASKYLLAPVKEKQEGVLEITSENFLVSDTDWPVRWFPNNLLL